MAHWTRASAIGRAPLAAGMSVQFVFAILTAAFVVLSPSAAQFVDPSPEEIFDGCGTVIIDELYYCYLFQADESGTIYAVPGIDDYYPGDRLHIQGVAEHAVSFCTLDGIIIDPTITPCDEGCATDFDGNGMVDVFDLLTLLGQWGPCGYSCSADLDESGAVDVFDLLTLLSAWGPCE